MTQGNVDKNLDFEIDAELIEYHHDNEAKNAADQYPDCGDNNNEKAVC